jgi:hypothetical protein
VEGADALGLIAEVGIAIAGFAGVIAALRSPGGTIGAYAALRIWLLLGTSAQAVLLALVPFVFHFAGLDDDSLWALSSSAMTALVVAFALVNYYVAVVRGAMPAPEERAPGLRFVAPLPYALVVGIIVLQIANAAWLSQLWPFYLGLLGITAWSLFLFAYILFAPSRAEVPA